MLKDVQLSYNQLHGWQSLMPECGPGERFSGYAFAFDAQIEPHGSCFLSLPIDHNFWVHVIPKINRPLSYTAVIG